MFSKKSAQKTKNVNQLSLQTVKDELPLERQTQISSITRIIRDSLDKLKISLILPRIFENMFNVRQRLKDSDYENCIKLMEAYIREKELNDSSIQPHLNYRLIKIIDFFHEHISVIEYFNDWLEDLNTNGIYLMQSFHILQKITQQRLKKTAISELNKEKKLHEIYHENENAKKNIKIFQNLLKRQRINLKWKLGAKEGIIQKYEKDLATCKYENNIMIKQEIVRSSHNIRQIHASSVVKQKELKDELERVKKSYEHLLEDNLKKEKSARDEKNKLLLQLQTLIKKFDQTMGDRIKENLLLQEEYERQKQMFDEFMIEYNKEEAEYESIVHSKEEEEKRQHEQKILLFMMNRSARAIQKHWRKFRRAQKKAAKRSKGRGKPKNKK